MPCIFLLISCINHFPPLSIPILHNFLHPICPRFSICCLSLFLSHIMYKYIPPHFLYQSSPFPSLLIPFTLSVCVMMHTSGWRIILIQNYEHYRTHTHLSPHNMLYKKPVRPQLIWRYLISSLTNPSFSTFNSCKIHQNCHIQKTLFLSCP
jgi:hypothetical protein